MTYNQTQGSSAFGVDQEKGRDGGQDLNGTVSKRRIESFLVVVTDSLEDTRTVERDDCMDLEQTTDRERHGNDLLLMPHIC